jgi:RNA polymerase sigma factor (sigma-70 family)
MTSPRLGNGPDWDAIFQDHGRALLRTSRRALGREPGAVVGCSADDVVQQTFTYLMSEGLQYQGTPYQLRKYLQNRAKWVLSEVFREERRRRGRIELDAMLALPDTHDRPATNAAVVANDEISAADDRIDDARTLVVVFDHFGCLTPNQQQVLVTYILQGQSATDVAWQMGVTDRRVRQLAARTLRKLRECIENPNHPRGKARRDG